MKNELIHSINLPFLVAALVLAALALLVACRDDDSGDTDASGEPEVNPGLPVECTVGQGQRGLLADVEFSGDNGLFDEGDDIAMTLTLINCGDNEVRLSFPTTKRYEFSIEDEDGIEIWNSSDGKAFSQVTGRVVIAVAERVAYTETWEQENFLGEQVPLGTYRVSALSVGCGQEDATDCKFGPIRLLRIVE